MSKLSQIEQIRQLQERNVFNEHRRFYKRFDEIDHLLDTQKDPESKDIALVLKYIPTAAIACFEGVFRSIVKELIDIGRPYTNHLGDLEKRLQIKLTFDILLEIQAKSITIGELIAHVLPCNRLEDVDTALSIILGHSFLDALKNHRRHPGFKMRQSSYYQFNKNHTEIYADVKKLFDLRHILCHEIAFDLRLDFPEVVRCYNNIKALLKQIGDFVSYTLDPDMPEDVEGMVERKHQEMKNVDAEVLNLLTIKKYEKSYDIHVQDNYIQTYDDTVESWKQYRDAKARNRSSTTPSATWGSYSYCQSMIDTSKAMIESLSKAGKFS